MVKRWWPLSLAAGVLAVALWLLLPAGDALSWRDLPERRSFHHNLHIVTQSAVSTGTGWVYLRESSLVDPAGRPTSLSWDVNGYGPETRLWAALFKSLRGEQASVLVTVSDKQRATEPGGNVEADRTAIVSGARELRLQIDGRSVPTRGWYGGSIGGRLWSQMVHVSVPDLVHLTRAGRITGSAFGQEFMLTPEQMEALRDMASQIRLLYEHR